MKAQKVNSLQVVCWNDCIRYWRFAALCYDIELVNSKVFRRSNFDLLFPMQKYVADTIFKCTVWIKKWYFISSFTNECFAWVVIDNKWASLLNQVIDAYMRD